MPAGRQGLILLLLIALIAITMVIGGGVFWYLSGQKVPGLTATVEKKKCNQTAHKREFNKEPYYTGPLIDSHVHLPTAAKIVSSIAGKNGLELPVLEGDLSADRILCLFESQGITKTFGFHITSKFAEGAAVSAAKEIEAMYPGKIVHFLMPPPVKFLNIEPSGIEEILNTNKGLFKGFGEVALYMDSYEGAKPNDSDFLQIYKLADQHNLIVMIHPEDNLRDGVEEILQKFPQVTFFFHGGEDQEWLIDLMPKYKNFYYSVDANILSIYGFKKEHQLQKPTKEEYVAYMRENFDAELKEALDRWKAIIETNPDRFTWGTDRWFAWHFDPEVGGILEEFSRSFIGRLNPRVQENFAHKNAQRMSKR